MFDKILFIVKFKIMLIVNGNIFFMLFQHCNLITWKHVPM